MPSSPPPGRATRATLLELQSWLAEADRSVAGGELEAAASALQRVGSALDLYRRRQQDAIQERAIQTARDAARRVAVLTLTRALAEIEASLATGDLERVKSRLEKAKDVVSASQALEDSSSQSGIRNRFPGRMAK
jgi:hypothetical protein